MCLIHLQNESFTGAEYQYIRRLYCAKLTPILAVKVNMKSKDIL